MPAEPHAIDRRRSSAKLSTRGLAATPAAGALWGTTERFRSGHALSRGERLSLLLVVARCCGSFRN